uniref:Uncharacterized protein n=1 Tax=Globodera rostochiensis TaxID=31243 RepID=A0A914HKQ4_GLORO
MGLFALLTHFFVILDADRHFSNDNQSSAGAAISSLPATEPPALAPLVPSTKNAEGSNILALLGIGIGVLALAISCGLVFYGFWRKQHSKCNQLSAGAAITSLPATEPPALAPPVPTKNAEGSNRAFSELASDVNFWLFALAKKPEQPPPISSICG